jgi:hypothetical protein
LDTSPRVNADPDPLLGAEVLTDANMPGIGFEKIVTAAP